jgi:TIR domain
MAKWEKPFISYAREDQEFALRLKNDLEEKHGKQVLIDANIQGGEEWSQTLDDGLEAADVVILVVSRNSRNSNFVKKELLAAQKLGKRIIPVIYKRYGSWTLIEDLQHIDFIGWYDEGLAKLLQLPLPSRPWWRWILIQLNRHGVQLLLILIALVAALIAYRYYYSTSDTHFRLASSDASAIVLLVENRGGRSSTLLGNTFAMQFGGLPVGPEGLVPVGPARAISIPGHDDVEVRLTFANVLTPRNVCDGALCTKAEVFPLIPNAAIVVTGKVRESDDRVVPRQGKVNGALVQKFIETHYPEVPEP